MTSFISIFLHLALCGKQIDLPSQVSGRLNGLEAAAVESKAVLDAHTSSLKGITNDAKRKWEQLSVKADNDSRESADFSAAKHCRMEVVLQKW